MDISSHLSIRIKFCGITRKEDVITAVKLGVDYIGFIFYAQSPRFITPEMVLKLCEDIDFQITHKVGVFVNTPIEQIMKTATLINLDVLQVYGNNDPESIEEMQRHMGTTIWKAVRIKDRSSLKMIHQTNLTYFIIDTYSPQSYGGTGKRIDSTLLKAACQLQGETDKKIIVAGGLNSQNIEEVVHLSPWGVDINSGVEISPGVKDPNLMESIVKKIRDYPKPINV